jgi:hypothetical protein
MTTEEFEHFKIAQDMLIDTLRENMCGDVDCMKHRVNAAIMCLKGDITHVEYAEKVCKPDGIPA